MSWRANMSNTRLKATTDTCNTVRGLRLPHGAYLQKEGFIKSWTTSHLKTDHDSLN